jgi:hypothetical protein
MKSGLDWTVVRPVGLTDNEEIKDVLIGNVKHSHFISRKTVAKFLIGCLETDEFMGKAVVISGK